MRRAIGFVTLGILAILPVTASAGNLDLRAGGFLPRADSNLFDDDAALYGRDGGRLERSDWNGFTGGIGFNSTLARNVELGFSADVYKKTLHTSYNDFVADDGREIRQSLKLDIVPVGVTLRLIPTGHRARLAPYVGVGADLFFYKYEEFGEFIDFGDVSQPILQDSFQSTGVAPGFHVEGGVRVPLGDDFSLVGGLRYQWAKDDMGDDFRGNRIDLSGTSATVGINLHF